MRHQLLVLVTLSVLAGLPAAGQPSAAWFGAPLPAGLGEPPPPKCGRAFVASSGDTLDTISTPGLERAARFHAFFIDEIVKTDRAALQPE